MKLPQCEILYAQKNSDCKFLFVAGGKQPSPDYFKILAQDKKIICVDKGIEICRDCDILPKILVGDFDSAEKSALNWAIENKIPIERHPVEKDLTDTQLALKLLTEKNSAIITGIFGGRFDHLFSNVYTCASVANKIFLADEQEIIFYVKGSETVEINFYQTPYALSLLPISETCEGVTTKNLHWEISNATLNRNFPNAVSNRIESSNIKISIKQGTLAVYLFFNAWSSA